MTTMGRPRKYPGSPEERRRAAQKVYWAKSKDRYNARRSYHTRRLIYKMPHRFASECELSEVPDKVLDQKSRHSI